MNPLKAETLRLLEAIREAKEAFRLSLKSESDTRQDLLYFRHREQDKR